LLDFGGWALHSGADPLFRVDLSISRKASCSTCYLPPLLEARADVVGRVVLSRLIL
jgi:hypothetical protein